MENFHYALLGLTKTNLRGQMADEVHDIIWIQNFDIMKTNGFDKFIDICMSRKRVYAGVSTSQVRTKL